MSRLRVVSLTTAPMIGVSGRRSVVALAEVTTTSVTVGTTAIVRSTEKRARRSQYRSMAKNCGCHCCRNYAECDEGRHSPEELLWAKYYGKGQYWWAEFPEGGVSVRICLGCQDYLADGAE